MKTCVPILVNGDQPNSNLHSHSLWYSYSGTHSRDIDTNGNIFTWVGVLDYHGSEFWIKKCVCEREDKLDGFKFKAVSTVG